MKKLIPILVFILASCTNQQDRNTVALYARIDAYMMNPKHMPDVSNYKALEHSAIDTLADDGPGGRAYKMNLTYEGLNSASRKVRREATVYFNKGFEVLEVITTNYLDAMSKEEYKKMGKTNR